MNTAIFQKINIGEDINNELGISEKAKTRTYTPQTAKPMFMANTIMTAPQVSATLGGIVAKKDMRTGGVRPTKTPITPVPPSGSADTMPSVSPTSTITAPAPLPAMTTSTEEKKEEGKEKKELNAAPKNKMMLWLGIAVIIGVGYYIIKK